VCEDKGLYQNSAGADLPKSAPETEVLVPRAKHVAPIDVTPHQGRATHESLPAVEWTPPYSRCEGGPTDKNRTKNGHENILFMGKKTFTIEEQYIHQNDKIYAQTSSETKEKVPRVQRGHHPCYVMVWWGVSLQGDDTSLFL